MRVNINISDSRYIIGCLLIIFSSIFLTACGGSAPADSSNPENSSNWNELEWDQDNWA